MGLYSYRRLIARPSPTGRLLAIGRSIAGGAFVSIPGEGVWYPGLGIRLTASTPAFTASTIDATGEKMGWVLAAPKAGTLDLFEFRTAGVTTWQNLTASFQNLDASGLPDETADQSVTVTGADTDDNVWKVPGSFSAGRTVTQGEFFAAVLEYAGTVGSMAIVTSHTNTQGRSIGFPYAVEKVGAGPAWAKLQVTASLPLLLKYSDSGGSWALPFGAMPVTAFTADAINTGTTPDIAGIRFQLPFSAKVKGVHVPILLAAAADFRVIIVPEDWNGTDAPLATTGTVDGDFWSAATNNRGGYLPFTAEVEIERDTWFRCVAEPLTANSITIVGGTAFNTDGNGAARIATIGGDGTAAGNKWHFTSAKDPTADGSWTNTTSKTAFFELRISSVDDGAGGGGGAAVQRGRRRGYRTFTT